MKREKTYIINGVIHLSTIKFDVNNFIIRAYSEKQAKLRLAFRVKEQLSKDMTIGGIYKAINRSKLTIYER